MAVFNEATYRPIPATRVERMSSCLRRLILHITHEHAGMGRAAQRASTYLGVDKHGEVWHSVETAHRDQSADGDTVDGNLRRIEHTAVLATK